MDGKHGNLTNQRAAHRKPSIHWLILAPNDMRHHDSVNEHLDLIENFNFPADKDGS